MDEEQQLRCEQADAEDFARLAATDWQAEVKAWRRRDPTLAAACRLGEAAGWDEIATLRMVVVEMAKAHGRTSSAYLDHMTRCFSPNVVSAQGDPAGNDSTQHTDSNA